MEYTEREHPEHHTQISHHDLYPSCDHQWSILKSDTDLLQWYCHMCHDGPSWYIFVCSQCDLKVCRQCAEKA
jgi:hypothetical protein